MSNILKHNFGSVGNKTIEVNTYQLFLMYWEFLLEGFNAVKESSKDNIPDVGVEEYFKTLLHVATDQTIGRIFVLTSKNGKPLGFIVLIDVTGMFQVKTLNVYLAYSNSLCATTIPDLRETSISWARSFGFVKVQAASYRVKPSPRICGAVRRWFNRSLGLRERFVVFETTL